MSSLSFSVKSDLQLKKKSVTLWTQVMKPYYLIPQSQKK